MKRPCPSCDAHEATVVVSIQASTIVNGNETYRSDAIARLGIRPDDRYDVVACARCRFVYAQVLPEERFLTTLYRHVIDNSGPGNTEAATRWTAHQLQLSSSLLLRAATGDPVRFLDYGCGDGTVVRALHAAGIACLGFEPHLRASSGDLITDSPDEVRGHAPFSAVLLSDVLEHVHDPGEVLSECARLLAPGGWICVSVPDFSPHRLSTILSDARNDRPVTRELNPWEHLNYFSPASLVRMVAQAGFQVDAEPAQDFGFRSSAKGLRRMTNTLLSAGRLVVHAARPAAGGTTIFAQKR